LSGDSANAVANKAEAAISAVLPNLIYTVSDNVLSITSPVSSTLADAGPSVSTTPGPYIYDTQQGFTIGGASTVLTEDVNAETSRVITVSDATGFPDSSGFFIINYGCEDQEGPIPYIARPSNGTLLISPAYFIQKDHPSGSSVLLIGQESPIVLPTDGSDYQPYLTDTASGRVYAQNLIDAIIAAGVTVIFTILYPNDIGLGKWDTPYSEVSVVYGP
jgi:hypothetical protein